MIADENPKIFLSYARSDEEFAIKLANSLKESGANIWIDQIDIPKGALWDHSVESAMKSSDCFLIVLSPASIESKNVIDEISYADEEKKTIIPLLYRNCKPPYRLRRYNSIDFTGDYETSLSILINSLGARKYSADTIHNSIRTSEGPTTWPHWINFTVSLNITYANEIRQIASSSGDEENTFELALKMGTQLIEKYCILEDYPMNMLRHFDISELWKGRDKLVKLFERWKNCMIREKKNEYLSLDWWSEICCQIVRSITRYRSVEIQVPVKSAAEEKTWYLPVVTEKEIRPDEEKMKFKICLFRIPESGKHLKISF